MESPENTHTLPAIVRRKLGITRYAMAQKFGRTPSGYTGMEIASKKYSLQDIILLKELGGYSWSELGTIIEALVQLETPL